MRGQTAKRAKTAKSIDTRVSKLQKGKVTGPRREKHIEVKFPDPPRPGNTVLTVDGLRHQRPSLLLEVGNLLNQYERPLPEMHAYDDLLVGAAR